MKKLIKALSLIMAMVMCLTSLSVSAFAAGRKPALPTSYGITALRNEFSRDVAPKEGNHALDYCYYSPVGKRDKTRYPLVIFLHGIGHADYEGAQLADSDMPYWASKELQSRFSEGGAFILLPRAPEDKMIYWSNVLLESLRAVIDDMIKKHGDNIDTTRIFIGGSSAGAEMAWNMIIAYPEYFAGAFPIAATGTVTENDVKLCKNVGIWMFACTKDPIVNYATETTPLWNNVCRYNSNPAKCRLTTFTQVVEPGGQSSAGNHFMAKVVTYDMHLLSGETYPNAKTVNGLGETVLLKSPNGIIKWMNTLSSSYNGVSDGGTGNTSVTVVNGVLSIFRNLLLKIVNIFQKIFIL